VTTVKGRRFTDDDGADVELSHQPEQYQHGESVVTITVSG